MGLRRGGGLLVEIISDKDGTFGIIDGQTRQLRQMDLTRFAVLELIFTLIDRRHLTVEIRT